MSSLLSLQGRLKDLSASLAHIHTLVTRLRNFSAAVGQGDEARLELGSEIHGQLKDAEEQLELLNVEVEALGSATDTKRRGVDDEKQLERERVAALAGRLTQDLKRTRTDFRNAQLQAKRAAETARRKERELLFSGAQNAEKRRESTEKLTQDDITVNASNDVTAALRRTHQLMQAELSRSQFAQQTLEQSTAALNSLSDSYTSLDTLISSSRNLIGSLLRSQKSDTWYLETAFYILIGTIAWLLFRRVLYGPLWWLLWLPLRLTMRFLFSILGAIGLSSREVSSSPSTPVSNSVGRETPAVSHVSEPRVQGTAGGGEMWDKATAPVAEQAEDDRLIDKIGDMVEENSKEETNVDDVSPEERQRQAELPRNPKKRMYEATEVEENTKDEL